MADASQDEHRVKGVIFTTAQQLLERMVDRGELRVAEDDAPECLTEKLDPAAWYTLDMLNRWTAQVRELVGVNGLVDFGWASAALLGETGIYHQFEVTLEEQGFSLGSKLVMSFAGISHPYAEFSLVDADPEAGVIVEVLGSSGWSDDQAAITLGWVHFLSNKLLSHESTARWDRTAAGDVRYAVEVKAAR